MRTSSPLGNAVKGHIAYFGSTFKTYLSHRVNEWYAGYSTENNFFYLAQEIGLLSKIRLRRVPPQQPCNSGV